MVWIWTNRPRSIYQYSNMAPRLSGQTSIFGVVFFVFKSLLGIERQEKLEKFAILTRKPRSHVRILIYRTWPIWSIRGVWVFTYEPLMLSSHLGLRRPFLCSRVFCSIFPFHFWFHKGMFWSGLKSKNYHASRDRTPFWICPSSSAYSRLCSTPQI